MKKIILTYRDKVIDEILIDDEFRRKYPDIITAHKNTELELIAFDELETWWDYKIEED